MVVRLREKRFGQEAVFRNRSGSHLDKASRHLTRLASTTMHVQSTPLTQSYAQTRSLQYIVSQSAAEHAELLR
jgi:hypothetical protein